MPQPTQPLAVATANPGKLGELRRILSVDLDPVSVDVHEIQSIDVADVIAHKARSAYDAVNRPVLVEDTGLSFHAWNGLPGALIKWFDKTVDNDGLCRMLDAWDDRGATAVCVIGYFDGSELHAFEGRIDGTIAASPRGANGFGWDAIFIPEGYSQTFGEMTSDQKDALSMRGIAARKLDKFLSTSSSRGMGVPPVRSSKG